MPLPGPLHYADLQVHNEDSNSRSNIECLNVSDCENDEDPERSALMDRIPARASYIPSNSTEDLSNTANCSGLSQTSETDKDFQENQEDEDACSSASSSDIDSAVFSGSVVSSTGLTHRSSTPNSSSTLNGNIMMNSSLTSQPEHMVQGCDNSDHPDIKCFSPCSQETTENLPPVQQTFINLPASPVKTLPSKYHTDTTNTGKPRVKKKPVWARKGIVVPREKLPTIDSSGASTEPSLNNVSCDLSCDPQTIDQSCASSGEMSNLVPPPTPGQCDSGRNQSQFPLLQSADRNIAASCQDTNDASEGEMHVMYSDDKVECIMVTGPPPRC